MLCFKNRTSLRQLALEARVTEFSNAISNGIRTESANSIGMQAWNNAFNNPYIFAPYNAGDRVAQMVVLPYPNVKLREVNNLSETDRGSGGFGSTGN
jgi:dUTPase